MNADRTKLNEAHSIIMGNTAWNILGAVLPGILSVFMVPIVIRSIGVPRFGILTLAWVVLGYFGLFDLGLGRATTKFLAAAFEYGRVEQVRSVFWTSLTMNCLFGVIGGGILASLTPLLVHHLLKIPPELQSESSGAFYLMALSIPAVTLTSTLQGTLEARHRFKLENVLQVPVAIATQTCALLVLPFTDSLTWLVGALVICRMLGTGVFLVAALRQMDNAFQGPFIVRATMRPLLTYGGWLTVSNVFGPIMVSADRFFIGAVTSMTAVAYYTTPYEAVTRLTILSQSLAQTIFPIFSVHGESSRRDELYVRSLTRLALILAPIVAILIAFAPDILRIWVGESFSRHSTTVLQILAIGVLANCLAAVPSTLIQGMGRPDITAKLHLIELPIYIFLIFYGVTEFGIIGAAAVWAIRATLDGFMLALYAVSATELTYRRFLSQVGSTAVFCMVSVTVGSLLYWLITDVTLKAEIGASCLGLGLAFVWRQLLTPNERAGLVELGRGAIARLPRVGLNWRR